MTVLASGTGQIAMLLLVGAADDVRLAHRRTTPRALPPETAAQKVARSLSGFAVSRQSS